jgi:hypothetical protein
VIYACVVLHGADVWHINDVNNLNQNKHVLRINRIRMGLRNPVTSSPSSQGFIDKRGTGLWTARQGCRYVPVVSVAVDQAGWTHEASSHLVSSTPEDSRHGRHVGRWGR